METDPGPAERCRYLLDSTFLIDMLRGDVAARVRFRRLFEDGDEPVVKKIVL